MNLPGAHVSAPTCSEGWLHLGGIGRVSECPCACVESQNFSPDSLHGTVERAEVSSRKGD